MSEAALPWLNALQWPPMRGCLGVAYRRMGIGDAPAGSCSLEHQGRSQERSQDFDAQFMAALPVPATAAVSKLPQTRRIQGVAIAPHWGNGRLMTRPRA
jgi:hypothetical protein